MENLGRRHDVEISAIESARNRLQRLQIENGLFLVEGQPSVAVVVENLYDASPVQRDEEYRQMQRNMAGLLSGPRFFTPAPEKQNSDRLASESVAGVLYQQAITGETAWQIESRHSGAEITDSFYHAGGKPESGTPEGMIPMDGQEYANGVLYPEIQNPMPPSLLSQNLLSLLQRPSFIASPLARWTSPPQWLQHQQLINYDEGMMVDGTFVASQSPRGPASPRGGYGSGSYESQSQVQINLQGLLQKPVEAYLPASSIRWSVPQQWVSSMDDVSIPIRGPQPSDNLMHQYDDGPMIAPPRATDPSATPAVTCHFGLMQQIGFGERNLEFFPETFGAVDAPFFAHRLRSQAANTSDLMFLVITDWQSWFVKALQKALPDFPLQTLQHFGAPQAASMLPSIDYNEGELTCIMEHINTRKESHVKFKNEREIDVGLTKAQCMPLVVWTRALGAIEDEPDRPLIVIISQRTDGISSKIIKHYSNDRYKRWDRLSKNQAWVYLDLYFLFTKWDRIWGAVKQNLQKRTEEVHSRRTVLPILQHTRQLHKDNNIMISLREHVRIHKASLKIVTQRVEHMLGGVDFMATQGLKGRLDDAYQLLEYYEVTATTLMEQQSNLLSLAFNLETIAQGQAVARLNALAFIFLPLSFVASVFGITTMTAPPMYYPISAVPVLLVTLFVAYIANQFFTRTALTESSPKSKTLVAQYDESDIEKSTSASDTRFKISTPWKLLSKLLRPKSKNSNQRFPTPGTIISEPPSFNDPSRLTRRSTDRSLAGRYYVPPRSTVQYLPGAYDLSGVGHEHYYSVESQGPQGTQSYDYAPNINSMPTVSSYGQYSPQNEYSYLSMSARIGSSYNRAPSLVEAGGQEVTQITQAPIGLSFTAPTPSNPPIVADLTSTADEISTADALIEYQTSDLKIRKAFATHNFIASSSNDLPFDKGDIITVINKIHPEYDWWVGRIGSRIGNFPGNFVDMTNEPNVEPVAIDPEPPDGDDTGYRPDGPDYFGLPPEMRQKPRVQLDADKVEEEEAEWKERTEAVDLSAFSELPLMSQATQSDYDTGYRDNAPDSFGLPPEEHGPIAHSRPMFRPYLAYDDIFRREGESGDISEATNASVTSAQPAMRRRGARFTDPVSGPDGAIIGGVGEVRISSAGVGVHKWLETILE